MCKIYDFVRWAADEHCLHNQAYSINIFLVKIKLTTTVMSEATKRKHVFQELQDPDFSIAPGQKIAKVLASKGNNLHEVCTVYFIFYNVF